MPASRPEDAPLWKAVRDGDVAAMRRALARGANPNAQGHKTLHGRDTMLVAAAQAAHPEAITLLMAHGATARAGRHGATPLLALVLVLPRHAPDPGRFLRCLDALLSRRPDLEAEGTDDSSLFRGNAMFHVLRQLPTSHGELAQSAFEKILASMAARKKPFSDGFSSSVLYGAMNFATPAHFEQLLGAGANIQSLGRFAAGPAFRVLQGLSSQPATGKTPEMIEQWWDVLARHDAPKGQGGPGIDPNLDARANAELARRRAALRALDLDATLAGAPPPSAPRRRI